MSSISMVSTYQIYILQGKKFFVANYWNEPVFFHFQFSFNVSRDFLLTELPDSERQNENTGSIGRSGERKNQCRTRDFWRHKSTLTSYSTRWTIFYFRSTNPTKMRETLLKFSEMLRYQLYECSSDYRDWKELHYIKNYIEIQMLRKTDRYKCTFTVSDSVKNFSLAPLLLTPFIENAF